MRTKKKTQEEKNLEDIARQVEDELGALDMQEVWRRYNLKYGNAKPTQNVPA